MQDAYTIQLEAVDGILVRGFLVLTTLHGRQGLEYHAVHLDWPSACNLQSVQDLRIAGDHRGVGVEPVGGGAHDNHVCRLIHRIQARHLRCIGIGHDSDPITFYPETGVSVPFDLHTCPLSALATFSNLTGSSVRGAGSRKKPRYPGTLL